MTSSRRILFAAVVLAACTAPPPEAASAPAPAPPPAPPPPTATAVAQRDECKLPPGDTLVSVTSADRTIRTDVRYATANNFTGAVLLGYEAPLALLRPHAAAALGRVQRRLRREGLGLKVFDGYRPVRATLHMVDWAVRTNNEWVLREGYVARESGHNRGHTVDLTLVRLRDGEELDMGTPYDTFSEAAHTANATGTVRENRMKLLRTMEAEGFRNYDKEWWHFRLPGEHRPLDVPLRCFR